MADQGNWQSLVDAAWEDPEFYKLGLEDRRSFMNAHDPMFKMLPYAEQNKVFEDQAKLHTQPPAHVAAQDGQAEAAKVATLQQAAQPGYMGIPANGPQAAGTPALPQWNVTKIGDAQIELPPEPGAEKMGPPQVPPVAPVPITGNPAARPGLVLPGSTGPMPQQLPTMDTGWNPEPPAVGPSTVYPVIPQPLVKVPQAQPGEVSIQPEEIKQDVAPFMIGTAKFDQPWAKAPQIQEQENVPKPGPVNISGIQNVAPAPADKDDALQAAKDLRALLYSPADGGALKADSKVEQVVNGLLRLTAGLNTPENVLMVATGAGIADALPALINTPAVAQALKQYPRTARLLDAASKQAVTAGFGAYGAATGAPAMVQGAKEGNLEKFMQGLGGVAIAGAAGAHIAQGTPELNAQYPESPTVEVTPDVATRRGAQAARRGEMMPPPYQPGVTLERPRYTPEMRDQIADVVERAGNHIAAEQWRNPEAPPPTDVQSYWTRGHMSPTGYLRQSGPVLVERDVPYIAGPNGETFPGGKMDRVLSMDGNTLIQGTPRDVDTWLQHNVDYEPQAARSEMGHAVETKLPASETYPVDGQGRTVDVRPVEGQADIRNQAGMDLSIDRMTADIEAQLERERIRLNGETPGTEEELRLRREADSSKPVTLTLADGTRIQGRRMAPPTEDQIVDLQEKVAQAKQKVETLAQAAVDGDPDKVKKLDEAIANLRDVAIDAADQAGFKMPNEGLIQRAEALRRIEQAHNAEAPPFYVKGMWVNPQVPAAHPAARPMGGEPGKGVVQSPTAEQQAPATEIQPPPPAAIEPQTAPAASDEGPQDETAQTGPRVTYFTGAAGYPEVSKAARERGDIGVVVTPQNPGYLDKEDYPSIIVDNGGFTKSGFEPAKFTALLDKVASSPNRDKVKFVVAPDVPFDAAKTLELFKEWAPKVQDRGLPVAFALQNGAENHPELIPWGHFDTLFIAGDDDFKEGKFADPAQTARWREIIQHANDLDLPIHIGRVNSMARLSLTAYGHGAISMDGTHIGKAGPTAGLAAIQKWLDVWNRGAEDHTQDNFIDTAADESIAYLKAYLDEHLKNPTGISGQLTDLVDEAQKLLDSAEGFGLRDDKARELRQLIEAARGSFKPMKNPGHPAAQPQAEETPETVPTAHLQPGARVQVDLHGGQGGVYGVIEHANDAENAYHVKYDDGTVHVHAAGDIHPSTQPFPVKTPTGQKPAPAPEPAPAPAPPKKVLTEEEIRARAEEIARRVAEEAKKKALAGGKLKKAQPGGNPAARTNPLLGEFYEIDPADLDDEMVKQIGEMGVALFKEVSVNPRAWKPAMLKIFKGIESRIDDIYDAAADAQDAINREAAGEAPEETPAPEPEPAPKQTADESIAERTGLPVETVRLLNSLTGWLSGAPVDPGDSGPDDPGLPQKANNPQFERYVSYMLGKTIASGKISNKEMYDILEAALNKYLSEFGLTWTLPELRALMDRLPTQAVRSGEQVTLQQFSTPPSISWLVGKLANVRDGDTVAEPSAGTASLITMLIANNPDGRFIANEIDPKRAALVKWVLLGLGDHSRVTTADAEIINADPAFPKDIVPTLIVMNPPFSSTVRGFTGNEVGYRHVMAALKLLAPGGRLVAILGEGAGMDRSNAKDFWRKVMDRWNVRANVGLDGGDYYKYGTTFGNRIVVIDATGPTADASKVITGEFTKIEDLYAALERIAEDRPTVAPSSEQLSGPTGGQPGSSGSGSGTPGSSTPGSPTRTPTSNGPGKGTGGTKGPQSEPGSNGPAGSGPADTGEGDDSDGGSAVDATGSPIELTQRKPEEFTNREDDDENFVEYVPTIDGAEHNGKIVETKVMASVPLPKINYKPQIPEWALKDPKPGGGASALQVEFAALAGQRFGLFNRNGVRMGIFNGDGTGVGKTRQIALVMWDQWNRGNKKILALSVKQELFEGLRAELERVGAKDLVAALRNLSDVSATEKIEEVIGKDAVIFSTYATFIAKAKGQTGQKRVDQLMEWLGEEPLIVFDEAHKAKNAVGSAAGASQTGTAVVEIQENLPKARILYASATGATEVRNMAYMTRLGLFGGGTPFPNGFEEFMMQMADSGLAGMELVARELKAMGAYLTRSLSYRGIQYSEAIHNITKDQANAYNVAVRAWQKVFAMAGEAIDNNNAKGSDAWKNFSTPFWTDHQRFFRSLLVAFKVPTVIDMTEKALRGIDVDGNTNGKPRSVVISLVGTGEAQAARAVAAAEETGDDLDFSPRDILENMIRKAYPTLMYEEVPTISTDAQGRPHTVMVKVPVTRPDTRPGHEGETIFVHNPEEEAKRDALIKEVHDTLALPDNPLDAIAEYFGRDRVAEITGRTKVAAQDPITGKWGLVPRLADVPSDQYAQAEADAFQNGTKRVIIISKKANEGINLHADKFAKNQQQRLHVVLEVPWSADDAMQSFGRTHRTNEAVPPEYVILSTDLGGERRFSSTIARRLSSLGALTKGQRDAGSSNVLAKYNFETDQGILATQGFYNALLAQHAIPGLSGIDPIEVLRRMGVLVERKDSEDNLIGYDVKKEDKKNVKRLLNRILNLETHEQNQVYDFFTGLFDTIVARAIEAGTLDTGVNTMRGDNIRLVNTETLVTDPDGGVGTYHYTIEVDRKNKPVGPDHLQSFLHDRQRGGIFVDTKGNMVAIRRTNTPITNADGSVEPAYELLKPEDRETLWRLPQRVLAQRYESYTAGEAAAVTTDAQTVETYTRMERDAKQNFEAWSKSNPEPADGYKDYWESTKKYYEDRVKRSKDDRIKAEKKLKESRAALVKQEQAAVKAWHDHVAEIPEYRTDREHIIGGRVLPIWNILRAVSARLEIQLAVTTRGERLVGPVLNEMQVHNLRSALGGQRVARTPEMIFHAVLDNDELIQLQGFIRLRRGRVGQDKAIILDTRDYNAINFLDGLNVPKERRGGSQWTRYIPNDAEMGIPLLARVLEQYPELILDEDEADDNDGDEGDASGYLAGHPAARPRMTAGDIAANAMNELEGDGTVSPILGGPQLPLLTDLMAKDGPTVARSAILKMMSDLLNGVPIRVGKFRLKALGIYKNRAQVIRLKEANDLPVGSHEFGHALHERLWGLDKSGHLDDTALQPYTTELENLASQPLPGQSKLPEGFAEFIRLYLTRHADAFQSAPSFYQFFEGTVLAAQPDLRDGLWAIRDETALWTNQGADRRLEGSIRMTTPVGVIEQLKRDYNGEAIYRKVIDSLRPVYIAEKELEQMLGYRLPADKSFYTLARLLAGWIGKAEHFMRRGTFEARSGAVIGEPLQAILRDADKLLAPDEFGEAGPLRRYLIAKRAIEKAAPPKGFAAKVTGIAFADAMKIVTEYPQKYKDIELIADRLYNYQDSLLRYVRDQGMISERQYLQIKHLNEFYIPFYRLTEFSNVAVPSQSGRSNSRRIADVGSVIRPFKGSAYEILDPIESILYNTYAMISAADRNRVGIALIQAAQNATGYAKIIEHIAPDLKPTTIELKEIEDALKIAGADVDNMDLSTLATVFRPNIHSKTGENQITIAMNGKRRLFQVDPDLHRALHALDQDEANLVSQLAAYPTRLLRLGATALSPEFILRNITRDGMDAFMQSRNGFIPGLDTIRGLASAMNHDDAYWEWARSGGMHAALMSLDRERLQEQLRDLMATPMQNVKRHPIEALRKLGELSEEATRLGEYKKARKRGKSAKAAAFDSREITLDFARMGTSARSANMIVAFWNANNQGLDKFIREHRENAFGGDAGTGGAGGPLPLLPAGKGKGKGGGATGLTLPPAKGKVRRVASGTVFRGLYSIFLPTLLLYLVNRHDQQYRDMPRYMKDRYFMLPAWAFGAKKYRYIPVPKPFLYGLFYSSIPERFMEWLDQRDPRAFDDLWQTVSATIFPGIIPTAALVPVELWAGKDSFTGRDIEPKETQTLLPQYRSRSDTSTLAREMADSMAAIGVQVSPSKIDHAITGYTAGAGTAVWKMADRVIPSPTSKPAMTLSDVPGARAFVVRSPLTTTQSVNDLYQRLSDLEQKKASAARATKHPTGIAAGAAQLTPVEMGEYHRLKTAAKQMTGIATQLNDARGARDLSGDEKRQRIDDLGEQRNQIAWMAMHPAGHPAIR